MENMQNPPARKWIWWTVGIIVILIVGAGAYLIAGALKKGSLETSSSQKVGQAGSIPQKILDNKFGWLGGGSKDDGKIISEMGGAWTRPHPGPFVWDMMQKGANSAIDFSQADEIVKSYQGAEVGMLATIWPFADWDQKNLVNANNCKVSASDEFLPKNDKKGRDSYLPEYRCNPSDWAAYQKFVQAVVERYDGDGKSDMAGLKLPVKYWEVMNEPDLQYQNNLPAGEQDRLNFYKLGPTEYGQLLIKTSQAIRLADASANVLIAGAAGADTRMLNFYREVFKDAEAKTSFDFGNVHCISNDRQTHDFNVAAYKKMLAEFGLSKSIWVTEAEAFYPENKTADENFESTKNSVAGALNAGAERIFFTRYSFDDFRTDMSQKTDKSTYPNAEKFRDIIKNFSN